MKQLTQAGMGSHAAQSADADNIAMSMQATPIWLPVIRATVALLVPSALILTVMSYSGTSTGAIFSCQSGEIVVFQDRPCPVEKPADKSPKTTTFPLSIHESWFAQPEQAEARAFCDRRGCECGRIEKKHQSTLVQTVADALYLDGSWNRYDASYQAWLDSPSSSRESFVLREQMMEASCDILISQVLLRSYADNTMQTLKKHALTAEERGFDVETPCLQGVEQACEFYDYVQLLSQMNKDAVLLRRKREKHTSP